MRAPRHGSPDEPRKEMYPMRSFRLLAAGASALALFVSACQSGGAPSPTTAAAPPTTAPAKPAAASPAASPATAASPSASPAAAAASPKPVASPAASPAAAVASPSAAASPVAGGPKPTVNVASFNFDESEILQELYAQILE